MGLWTAAPLGATPPSMPVIHVELVNAATGASLGALDVPTEQLPESFAKPTTLHLPDGEWQVERAEPMTAAEFVASGRLRLMLHRAEQVDPSKILFSVPTLEDALPVMRVGADDPIRIAEDDWRQLEFLAARYSGAINSELEAIRSVRSEAQGVGFPRCHVRNQVATPLVGVVLPISEVTRAYGDPRLSPLSFRDHGRVVEGGFAFTVESAIVYGRQEKGLVTVLGLARATVSTAAPLAASARAHTLILVDWCAARAYGSQAPASWDSEG